MAAAVLGESSYRPSNFVTRLHRPSNPTIDSVSTSTTTTPPLLAAAKYADEALRRQVNELRTSLSANTKLPPDRPFVVRDISLQTWRSFKATYARCQMFSDRKFEYESSSKKVISLLPTPFHNIATPIMSKHVIGGMRTAGLDTDERIDSLQINSETFEKRTTSGISQREPDCAIWTIEYQRGIVPTIVWEVGHSQKRVSLYRRAKMWARRYNGQVRAIILVKYTSRNPRSNPASILLLFRPARRADGKWTVVQDGPTYTLFPRPTNAPGDVVPLVYEDYFGPGNVVTVDPSTPYNLPLETVRNQITLTITAEGNRRGYRYVSGGSSVGGDLAGQQINEPTEDPLVLEETEDKGRGSPDIEFEDYGLDWNEAMSDVSDVSDIE